MYGDLPTDEGYQTPVTKFQIRHPEMLDSRPRPTCMCSRTRSRASVTVLIAPLSHLYRKREGRTAKPDVGCWHFSEVPTTITRRLLTAFKSDILEAMSACCVF